MIEKAGADVFHMVPQWGFLTKVPSIYHPHDLQHRHLPELFDKRQIAIRDRWYTALARRARMVAVASSWTREDVISQLGLPPEKVRVIPWAPPLQVSTKASSTSAMSEVNNELGLPDRYILYPAQTWPHKNHKGLLDALAILRTEGLDVPVVFTGARNAAAADIDAHIADLGIERLVKWLGFVEWDLLSTVFSRATAIVIPSRFEAASGPLWEAFAAGIPAACSNVTSLPDQAGDAALVFDPNDPRDIANAVRKLWMDAGLRRRLANRGRARIAQFTWDRTARTFRAHYRRLANRRLSDEDHALIAAAPGI